MIFEQFLKQIEKYYCTSKNKKSIFFYNKNDIENFEYSIKNHLIYFKKILLINFIEFFKSKLKKRPALYNKILVVQISFDGKMLGNFINGTFVIIEKDKVIKFYFKDVELYKKVYSALNIGDLRYFENFLVLEMNKYTAIESLNPKLINSIQNILSEISEKLHFYRLEKFLQPEYKIKQLFCNNKYPLNQIYFNYVDRCKKLQNEAKKYGIKACHGDLWKQNILLTKQNEIILIDYDKVMWFSPGYDFVYLYLMENIFNNAWSVNEYMASIDTYYFEYLKFDYPHISLDLFKINATLIILMKALELDISNKNLGYSLRYLND